MSSQIFGAERARELNIVSEIVAADQLDNAVQTQVDAYLRVAPLAARASKALVQSVLPQITDAMIESTVEQLADTWERDEALQGINAFLAKTPPPWAH